MQFVTAMNRGLTSLILLAASLLVGCTNLPVNIVQNASSADALGLAKRVSEDVYIKGNEIYYIGTLSSKRNERLFMLYDKASPKPTILNITSDGGSVELGMDLGEWVHKNTLDVRIPNECYSSCANYVFTAAHRVMLGSNAGIGWHGSPIIDDILEARNDPAITAVRWKNVQKSLSELGYDDEDTKQYWNNIRRRNRNFFRTVDVNPLITFAQSVATQDSIQRLEQKAPKSYRDYLTYLSIEDMAALGRNNISIEDNLTWRPENTARGADLLVFVELRGNVQWSLRLLDSYLSTLP